MPIDSYREEPRPTQPSGLTMRDLGQELTDDPNFLQTLSDREIQVGGGYDAYRIEDGDPDDLGSHSEHINNPVESMPDTTLAGCREVVRKAYSEYLRKLQSSMHTDMTREGQPFDELSAWVKDLGNFDPTRGISYISWVSDLIDTIVSTLGSEAKELFPEIIRQSEVVRLRGLGEGLGAADQLALNRAFNAIYDKMEHHISSDDSVKYGKPIRIRPQAVPQKAQRGAFRR